MTSEFYCEQSLVGVPGRGQYFFIDTPHSVTVPFGDPAPDHFFIMNSQKSGQPLEQVVRIITEIFIRQENSTRRRSLQGVIISTNPLGKPLIHTVVTGTRGKLPGKTEGFVVQAKLMVPQPVHILEGETVLALKCYKVPVLPEQG